MSQPSPSKTVITQRTGADQNLRSEINAQLIKDGHVERIHNHLAHVLASDPSNWPTRVRQHALSLLRSPNSRCDSFPKLIDQVLADIRSDTNAARREGNDRDKAEDKGEEYVSVDERDRRGEREGGGLQIPIDVVQEGVRITRECLEMVVEVRP